MMAGGSDGAGDDVAARAARLARDLEALRQGLEADPPFPPDEVRRRVDAIADEVLALGAPEGVARD